MTMRISDFGDPKDLGKTDLKRIINEKNNRLSSISKGSRENRDEIIKTKQELDYLLYLYYKSISEKCGNKLIC